VDISGRYLKVITSVLLTLLCVYLLSQLRGFIYDVWIVLKALIVPFLISMVVAYVLQPIVELLARRRVPRGVAVMIIYFAFLLLLVIGLLNLIPHAVSQFNQLIAHIPTLVQQADRWLDEMSRRKDYLPPAVQRGVEAALLKVEHNVTGYAAGAFSILSGTLGFVFIILVVPFLVFYMLKDAKAIGRGMIRLTPQHRRQQMQEILSGIDKTLGSYVRGQLLVMVIVGVLTYAGLLVVRMPYPLLLSAFLAITNMVPYLGSFIGAAPALLLAASVNPQMVLKVLVVNVIVQQLEGNLISPQIMGRTLHLHPMSIVAVLLIGGEVGGVLGLVVAVPVLAVIKVIWVHVQGRNDLLS